MVEGLYRVEGLGLIGGLGCRVGTWLRIYYVRFGVQGSYRIWGLRFM